MTGKVYWSALYSKHIMTFLKCGSSYPHLKIKLRPLWVQSLALEVMVSGKAGIQTSRCVHWYVPHEDLVLLYVHTQGDREIAAGVVPVSHLCPPGYARCPYTQLGPDSPLLTLRPPTTRGIESSNHLLVSDTGE